MSIENKIPKAYLYTVENIFEDDSEETLKFFTIPSLGRLLSDDFDLDSLASAAAQRFYLDYTDFQTLDKWPLKFKFYTRKNSVPIELEMNLNFCPMFMSTPKKIPIKIVETIKTNK